MRMTAFLPGICLALFATSALAQQAAPAPAAPEPGTGEVAPPPAAPPRPQPGAAPTRMEHHPRGMHHPMPMGAHHPETGSTPILRLRYGKIRLELPCSDDTATCANIALEIIDHLRQGGSDGGRRGDRRSRGHGYRDSDMDDDDM